MQRVALLFSDDIVQYIEIGRYLYQKFDYVRYMFEEASDILSFEIPKFFSESLSVEAAGFQIMQPVVLASAVAAFRVLTKELGITPCCATGKGLGEYIALTCSGAIRFSDSLAIAKNIELAGTPVGGINNGIAAEQLQDKLDRCIHNRMRFTVISSITGLPYECEEDISKNLATCLKETPKVEKAVEHMIDKGVKAIIAIGEGNRINAPGGACFNNLKAYSFKDKSDYEALENAFYRQEDRKKMISRCLALAACTRNSNWNDEEYHRGVIDTYERIKEINDLLEKEKVEPTIQQMEEALENLITIFRTKKVPESEQTERLRLLFRETGTDRVFSYSKHTVQVRK